MIRLLLDSHLVIAISLRRFEMSYPGLSRRVVEAGAELHVSTASLWEIAIKVKLGKLALSGLVEALAGQLRRGGIAILSVDEHHATASLAVEPPTRDPFDRMLLAQCQVEDMRLVTVDRALAGHPLAWREA